MERCPCCQARLREAKHCPRCRADLTWVVRSEQLSRSALASAVEAWCAGDPDLCMEDLSQSLTLKKTPTALLFRDFVIRRQLPEVFELLERKDFAGARRKAGALYRLERCSLLLEQMPAFVAGVAAAER